jgi:hypothetical protein
MATSTRTRTIRTGRSHHRRGRRRRRQAQRRLIVAAGLGLLSLLVLGGYSLVTRYIIPAAASTEYRCVEVVGADRSGSQNARAVTDRWRAEAETIIGRAVDCQGLIIAEDVYDQPGKGEVRKIPFRVHARNWLDKQQKLGERADTARSQVQEVLSQPGGGVTNLLGWFHAVENHLQDIDGEPAVNVTLFTDGINTMNPVNMPKADLSPMGVVALINSIRSDLPDCTGWRIRMLGVNTTSHGGVDPELAAGAERFWRAFVEACGGTLRSYDTAAQAA